MVIYITKTKKCRGGKMAKKILCIGLLVMMLVFVISCGEAGGTIVIENDSPNNWGVAIESSSTRSDSTTIQPGQKYEKSFGSNGTYYAFGNFTDGWRKKTVPLSGGETVILKSGDF
jgi:hypothetical protein